MKWCFAHVMLVFKVTMNRLKEPENIVDVTSLFCVFLSIRSVLILLSRSLWLFPFQKSRKTESRRKENVHFNKLPQLHFVFTSDQKCNLNAERRRERGAHSCRLFVVTETEIAFDKCGSYRYVVGVGQNGSLTWILNRTCLVIDFREAAIDALHTRGGKPGDSY